VRLNVEVIPPVVLANIRTLIVPPCVGKLTEPALPSLHCADVKLYNPRGPALIKGASPLTVPVTKKADRVAPLS